MKMLSFENTHFNLKLTVDIDIEIVLYLVYGLSLIGIVENSFINQSHTV